MGGIQAKTNGTSSNTVRPIYLHNHTEPTKRGWLFLGRHGGPCDKACSFCYYSYQNQLVFYDLNTLIGRANLFRHYYGLEYCDISGGEPTIYGSKKDGRRPELERLVNHCTSIGLKPTIISHGQNLTSELTKGIEQAGLEDWLISLHGMKAGHDKAVIDHKGKGEGGWKRLTDNLKNCTRPIRFNTTVQNFNYKELPLLAQYLVNNHPATVHNMILFNPFYAWAGKEVIEFQEQQSTVAPYIAEAIAVEEKAGWETNIRYFSPCIAAKWGFEKNCIGFYQTQYDNWEWSLCATNRAEMDVVKEVGGIEMANKLFCNEIASRRKNEKCQQCRFFGTVCEGPQEQYIKRYGLEEFNPSIGEQILDPLYFEKGGKFNA